MKNLITSYYGEANSKLHSILSTVRSPMLYLIHIVIQYKYIYLLYTLHTQYVFRCAYIGIHLSMTVIASDVIGYVRKLLRGYVHSDQIGTQGVLQRKEYQQLIVEVHSP